MLWPKNQMLLSGRQDNPLETLPGKAVNKPDISVIIPVYREEQIINDFVQRLTEIFPAERHEIIIIDGDPVRTTLSALHVPGVSGSASGSGRGNQMNAGAAKARGKILLFLHADTTLPESAPDLIQTALRDQDLAGGAFSLGIDSSRWSLKIVEAAANLRSKATRVPYGDQAIFITKEKFSESGGFRDIPIMEDLELMTRLKKMGEKIIILPDKAMTSARRWKCEGVARGTLRNWLIRILYHLGVSPQKLCRMYR